MPSSVVAVNASRHTNKKVHSAYQHAKESRINQGNHPKYMHHANEYQFYILGGAKVGGQSHKRSYDKLLISG